VDFRTDLFSFGIVFYELATGTHPLLRGSPSASLSRLMAAEYMPLTLGSEYALRRFERVVERCQRKDPDDRFESTDALVNMLENLASGRGMLWKLFGRRGSRRPAPAPDQRGGTVERTRGASNDGLPLSIVPQNFGRLHPEYPQKRSDAGEGTDAHHDRSIPEEQRCMSCHGADAHVRIAH
jgi:serine/threonine protein kinase